MYVLCVSFCLDMQRAQRARSLLVADAEARGSSACVCVRMSVCCLYIYVGSILWQSQRKQRVRSGSSVLRCNSAASSATASAATALQHDCCMQQRCNTAVACNSAATRLFAAGSSVFASCCAATRICLLVVRSKQRCCAATALQHGCCICLLVVRSKH